MIEFWSWPPVSLAGNESVMAGETELPQKSRTIAKACCAGKDQALLPKYRGNSIYKTLGI